MHCALLGELLAFYFYCPDLDCVRPLRVAAFDVYSTGKWPGPSLVLRIESSRPLRYCTRNERQFVHYTCLLYSTDQFHGYRLAVSAPDWLHLHHHNEYEDPCRIFRHFISEVQKAIRSM